MKIAGARKILVEAVRKAEDRSGDDNPYFAGVANAIERALPVQIDSWLALDAVNAARVAALEAAAEVADEHARACAMARSNANAMNDRKAAANADAERLGAELIAAAIRGRMGEPS